MLDDDYTDLEGSRSLSADEDSSEPKPGAGDILRGWLIAMGFIIADGIFFINIKDRPFGIPIAALVTYTFGVFYILTDRFLLPVPWDFLKRYGMRFLVVHGLLLAVVFGITTYAFKIKSQLPDWLLQEGRRGSLFDWCLYAAFFALAFWEVHMIKRREETDAADSS